MIIILLLSAGSDVPGTFPEGTLKVLTSWIYRGPSGDSWETNTKLDDLIKKKVFLDKIILVLHIYYHFLLEKQIFKSSKWECPRNIYGTHLWDVPGTKWWDVLGTSTRHRSYMFFNFNSELILKLFWQFPQDFIVNCSSKKSVNSIETKKKIKQKWDMMSSGRYY